MIITLNIDEGLVSRAQQVAASRGSSLDELVQRYLDDLVGPRPGGELADELFRLMDEHPASGTAPFDRDALHRCRR